MSYLGLNVSVTLTISMWSESLSLYIALVVLMDRDPLCDRDPVSICHRLISVTVGWAPADSATGCSQTCFKLAMCTMSQCASNLQRSTVSNRNLCALFSCSPLCTFKCHNVLETIAIYVLCSGLGMLLPEAD